MPKISLTNSASLNLIETEIRKLDLDMAKLRNKNAQEAQSLRHIIYRPIANLKTDEKGRAVRVNRYQC